MITCKQCENSDSVYLRKFLNSKFYKMASIVNKNWITGKRIFKNYIVNWGYQLSNLKSAGFLQHLWRKFNYAEVTDSILMSLRSTGLENLYKKFHQMAIFQLSLFIELIYSEKK